MTIKMPVPAKPEGVDAAVWEKMLSATPAEARHLIREGSFAAPTSGLCPGYAQANLIVLPKEQAYDFLLFAQRNPKPCPLLEVTETGAALKPPSAPPTATSPPTSHGYRIYEYGKLVDEVTDVSSYWRDDLVSFVIGCSFSFESELIEAGIEMRHNTQGRNVSMYLTNVACTPAGSMSGNTVMSMRPIPYNQVVKAVQISGRHPQSTRRSAAHRRPVGHRHRGHLEARLRRPRRYPRGRGARLLGLRRDAPGRGHELQASLRHHACARMHADNRHKER